MSQHDRETLGKLNAVLDEIGYIDDYDVSTATRVLRGWIESARGPDITYPFIIEDRIAFQVPWNRVSQVHAGRPEITIRVSSPTGISLSMGDYVEDVNYESEQCKPWARFLRDITAGDGVYTNMYGQEIVLRLRES